ncbi:MAG TPA: winged helix-turn-helix transcriptional regulator, partial [Candidatus Binatia bacterium]|nr:winged helix-turn-helix transcriptional regulator [Candidatus Binatia bacterium]
MSLKLDEKDLAILTLIQENSKLTANQIAKKINIPITTVFAKIKRMEEMGIIKQYRAILS